MFTSLQTCQRRAAFSPSAPVKNLGLSSVRFRSVRHQGPLSKRQVARLAQSVAVAIHGQKFQVGLGGELVLSSPQYSSWAGEVAWLSRGMCKRPLWECLKPFVFTCLPSLPSGTAVAGQPSAFQQHVRSLVAESLHGQGVLAHNALTKLAHKPCAGEALAPPNSGLRSAGCKYGVSPCMCSPALLPGLKFCCLP